MTECAGYEPRQARYGRNWGGLTKPNKHIDGYSGILECPCNSRYNDSDISLTSFWDRFPRRFVSV